MDEGLSRFLNHAREKGLDHPTTRRLLLSVGWKEKDIAAAVAEHDLDLPIPVPPGTSSGRETFLYLVAFGTLYAWTVSLLVLIFTYINLALPDPADSFYGHREEWAFATIRQSIATILVAFPLFLVVWRSLLREIQSHPEKAHNRGRIGLIYLTLLMGAITIISDVITLIYYLLEGELSTRFLLKVAALFVITAVTFTYFALNLREMERDR